jgi:hypothetical protein
LKSQNPQFDSEKQQISLPFSLSSVSNKKVEVSYTGKDVSTDGGALLLKEIDNQLGLIDKLSSCINDERDQRYVHHQINEMLSQRVFQIACGYEDGNDCNTLRDDSIFKLCAEKLPQTDRDLASQPTMCRLENSISRSELYRIAKTFADTFISSYQEEPGLIILDCDDTNNNTHGDQQLTLFNAYYGESCYMPLHIYEGLSGKLITTILKPGRRSKSVDFFALLKRIIAHLRTHWKNTIILLRGDSHFCSSQFMDWSAPESNIHFVTGLAGNQKLHRLAGITIESARNAFEANGIDQKRYHSFPYQASSWEHPQRVIVKVEVTAKGTNIRYIVTDVQHYRASHVYEKAFCARGHAELRIKEHKLYLKSDRSSCGSFLANQFRLFLHSAAYVLIHSLQKEVLAGTDYANATMKTIQLKILKTAAWVEEMKTKVKIILPQGFANIVTQRRAFDILAPSG